MAHGVLQPGDRLGRYSILQLIGSGAMGSVYVAADPELNRRIAVKVLKEGLSEEDRDGLQKRMLREAQAMARLQHPNVVAVHDVGVVDGSLFIAMDLIDGTTLRQWLAEAPRSWREILAQYLRAGRGLAAAHAAGLVRRIEDAITNETLVGTPAYMAPEQMRGQPADTRSDLFGFCTALYESLAGVRPYAGSSLYNLRQQLERGEIAPPKKRFPGWLRRELVKGLDPEPTKRQQSLSALLDSIEAQLTRRKQRLALAGALGLVVISAGLTAILNVRTSQATPQIALFPTHGPPGLAQVMDELLTAELAQDPKLRLAPPADAVSAASDLSIVRADPASWDLSRLQQRMPAHVYTSGSLELLPDGAVSFELTVQQPSGSARFVEKGQAADLPDLADRVNKDLRGALRLRALDQPPTPQLQAAKLYAAGVALQRTAAWSQAQQLLTKARQLAPDDPRIAMELAQVLVDFRRQAMAQPSATKAANQASSLTPDEQVRARILRLRSLRDHEAAATLARARWEAAPRDFDRALDLLQIFRVSFRHKEALELAAQLPREQLSQLQLAELLELQADEDLRVGQVNRALAAAQEAVDAAHAAGATVIEGRATYQLGRATRSSGNADRALQLYSQAQELLQQAGDAFFKSAATLQAGTIYTDRGEAEKATPLMESAIAASHELGEDGAPGEAAALYNYGVLLRKTGERRQALNQVVRATSLFTELKQTTNAVAGYSFLGLLRFDLGDLPGASEALQQALALSREDPPGMLSNLRFLARLRLVQGQLDETKSLLERARSIDPGEDKMLTPEIQSVEVDLALAQHRFDDAAREAQAAAALFSAGGDRDSAAELEARCAEAHLDAGRIAEARKAVARSSALLAASRSEMRRGLTKMVSARLLYASSPAKLDEALASLKEIAEDASQRGRAMDAWQARLTSAELELDAKRPGAKTRLATVERSSREEGFLLYANEAASLLKSSSR